MFVNSYAQNLYEIQQKIREKSDTGQSQVKHENRHGAEKFRLKTTEQRIARNEYGAEESAKMYKELERCYRLGMNPSRDLLEQIYER